MLALSKTQSVLLLTCLQIVNSALFPRPKIPTLLSIWNSLDAVTVCLYSRTLTQQDRTSVITSSENTVMAYCTLAGQTAKLTMKLALERSVSTAAALTI